MTLIAAVFFGGLGAIALFVGFRRRAAFERLAERYGLKYYHEGDAPVYLPAEFIDEVKRGIVVDAEVRRAVAGRIDGTPVACCELRRFRARSGGGEQGYYSLAVGLFDLSEPLPEFSLDPEKLRHKVSARTRDTDIDFDDSPRFSKTYLLRGEEEGRVREIVSKPVRDFLERHPNRCVRCYGSQLVYYRPVRLLKWAAFRPRPVEALLNEGLELTRLLRRS